MPNQNAPFGFRPARHVTGYGHSLNKYTIASGLAEDIGFGEPVKMTGTGRNIARAAAGDAGIGVFAGVEYTAPDGSYKFEKAWRSGTTVKSGTVAMAHVHDDPMETFIVQTLGTITADDVGQFVDVSAQAPDLSVGISRSGVSSPGGSESQFRIERIIEEPQRVVDANNNTVGYQLSGAGQYAIVEVKWVKHQRLGSTLGVEV